MSFPVNPPKPDEVCRQQRITDAERPIAPVPPGRGLVAAVAASLILTSRSGGSVDPAKPTASDGTGKAAASKPAAQPIVPAPRSATAGTQRVDTSSGFLWG